MKYSDLKGPDGLPPLFPSAPRWADDEKIEKELFGRLRSMLEDMGTSQKEVDESLQDAKDRFLEQRAMDTKWNGFTLDWYAFLPSIPQLLR